MAEGATISSRTGLAGILGHPVGHSLSPRMHNAAFRAQGLDMVYLAFDVLPEELAGAVNGVRSLGLRGVNVTIPHKEAIIGLLDDVEESARRIGAVNTVVNRQGVLSGYNTDKIGFSAALRGLRAEGAAGLTCLVAGAGGAARAVVAALVEDGAKRVLVWNRTPERAATLCTQAAEWGGVPCEAIEGATGPAAVASADLVVNATSVGLRSHIKESAIPVDNLTSNHIVVDLVYGSEATMLVREAKARGATAIDGKDMLVRQAAGSYELWTGLPAPAAVMRESIDGNG
jgi:shikimate dehydrogenase